MSELGIVYALLGAAVAVLLSGTGSAIGVGPEQIRESSDHPAPSRYTGTLRSADRIHYTVKDRSAGRGTC